MVRYCHPARPARQLAAELKSPNHTGWGRDGMSRRKGRRRMEPLLAFVSPVLYFSVHRYFQERLYACLYVDVFVMFVVLCMHVCICALVSLLCSCLYLTVCVVCIYMSVRCLYMVVCSTAVPVHV